MEGNEGGMMSGRNGKRKRKRRSITKIEQLLYRVKICVPISGVKIPASESMPHARVWFLSG